MARRKKTVLLKSDLEDLIARLERDILAKTEQCDKIIASLPDSSRAYYYGRRATLTEFRDFLKDGKASYLD